MFCEGNYKMRSHFWAMILLLCIAVLSAPARTQAVHAAANPIGCVDEVKSTSPGTIYVRGWAYDKDIPSQSIKVHVYVGGPWNSGAPGYEISANVSRPDVNQTFGISGKHGFSTTINVSKTGSQTIYFYGINVGGAVGNDYNTLLGTKTVSIVKDSIKPTISNVKVTNQSSNGYTVTCTVSDNYGIKEVLFPTWTARSAAASDQDDLKWHKGTVSGNTASYTVKVSEHNYERDIFYVTHIYAYDKSGNSTCYKLNGLYIANPTTAASTKNTAATTTKTAAKPSVSDRTAKENSIRQKSGKAIIESFYADFDGDGRKEVFAAVGQGGEHDDASLKSNGRTMEEKQVRGL